MRARRHGARHHRACGSSRQIRQARNEERAALDRLKSQLLANVSHELRTPLVSIKGYNELLLRGTLGPLTPRQRRGLEIAGANTERLVELIETLLDFARREEGRLELSIGALRSARGGRGRAAAPSASASPRATCRCGVDLGDAPLPVIGDRARLAQVFRALIGNAEKFSEQPRRRDRGLTRERRGDRGRGLRHRSRHRHPRRGARASIFDRFYQVDASSTRRFGGAGLGLALAKELVTLHDGEIAVDSAEGRGSTFTVRLPLAPTRRRRRGRRRPAAR